ncbi:putative beta-lysine N-acetyltransferase [bacterium]|nr:putative beta-lysine N-acetyltransferase [bacterium]
MDCIEKVGKSTIQHGPESDRIYLMKLDCNDLDSMPGALISKAKQHGYSKIFCKLSETLSRPFLEREYIVEAEVPGLFYGTEKGLFLSYYLSADRQVLSADEDEKIKKNLALAFDRSESSVFDTSSTFQLKELTADTAESLSGLYREVFDSYPFPIGDSGYIQETMASHVRYFGVYKGGQLVAASSAELDFEANNAEMTDFATLPEFRGYGLAKFLLIEMEGQLNRSEIKTAYTIARAFSPGMNITFHKAGYRFAGTLINNTQISGRIESMNVWYKSLDSI